MKVLIVMADQAKAAQLNKACISAGIHCQLAEGGFYALTMLERSRPDAIICSHDVVDMTGLEFYDIVRGDEALNQTAFILLDVMSAAALSSARDLSLDADAPPEMIVRALQYLKQGAIQEVPPTQRKLKAPQPGQMGGTLEILTLFDLILSLSQNACCGKLHLRLHDQEALILLDQGNIIHAQYLGRIGEDALLAIFVDAESKQDAEFLFEKENLSVSPSTTSISGPIKELLFKIAVALDHQRSGAMVQSR